MKKIIKLKYYHFANSNEVKELNIERLWLLISQKSPTRGLLMKEHTANYILPKQIRHEAIQPPGPLEERAKHHPEFAAGKLFRSKVLSSSREVVKA